MAIYAYRFYKSIVNKDEKSRNKNLVLFFIFSICSCYIHYYALVTAGVVNLILLIYVIKNRKNDKKALIYFLAVAVLQILLYIPWLIYFVGQLKHVNSGFWIEVSFIKTTAEILSIQFSRNVDLPILELSVALIISIIVNVYAIYKLYKLRKESKIAIISIAVYIVVTAIMAIISIKMPILYARYLIVMTGMYMFTLAFIISKEKNKIIIVAICIIILISGIICNIQNTRINYDKSNQDAYKYIDENIQNDDIMIYSSVEKGIMVGGLVAAKYPQNKQYFVNIESWKYVPQMTVVDDWEFLKDYKGRIWIIMPESMEFYDKIPKDNITILKDTKRFDTKYHDIIFNIMLVEKK